MTPGAGQPDMQQPDTGHSQLGQPACPPPEWTAVPRPVAAVHGDYDADDDGLIEVANLAQLDAIRYDRVGTGSPPDDDLFKYFGAFPNAVAGMGCPEAGCKGYELVADLDFDNNGNGRADAGDTYWNDGAGWLPIDGYGAVFDGGRYTIANLHINRTFHEDYDYDDGFGLFGDGFSGRVSGVALASVDVTGRSNVGGLVGSGRVSIRDSCVSGAVTGTLAVGGLVGFAGGSSLYGRHGSISGSYATGSVSGFGGVGGLVGSGVSSISESYATGTVTGRNARIGGLLGNGYATSINDSYATGNVSGGTATGGLAGSGVSSISSSYATGDVSGHGSVGGLVGDGYTISINDSYATGAVTGSSGRIGGLVGAFSALRHGINSSYATGAVTGNGDHVGGLVGHANNGSINASYATGAVSGGNNVGGLVGRANNDAISASYATGRRVRRVTAWAA